MAQSTERTAIFLDEAQLREPTFDWTSLRNKTENTSLIISFQPFLEDLSLDNKVLIKLKLPTEDHVNINLTRCYRTSTSILNAVQSLHKLNIQRLDTEANPVDLVSGWKPTLVSFKEADESLKSWMNCELEKLKCPGDQLAIIYTSNTKDDAFFMFENSQYSNSLTYWREFVGCEKPVVICFYASSEEEWQLFHIASRAQLQVVF